MMTQRASKPPDAPSALRPDAPASHPQGLRVFRIEVPGAVLALVSYEVSGATTLPSLSDAERAVMCAVLEGKTNAQIAAERATAPRTVANQVASLFQKLGVRSRAELAARFGLHR